MVWGKLATTQPNIVKILTNSIKKNRLAHAYLFEGPRGSGKMETALVLAKTFFCENIREVDPCNECVDCIRIDSGNHPDVHVIQAEGNSIKKEQVNYLRKEFSFRGMESRKKVYIVEESEKMTASAANSLLKFLEEPEGDTLAILITTNYFRMIETIVSRTQVLSFVPLAPEKLVEKLVEEGMTKKEALIVSQITTDMDEAIRLCEDNWLVHASDKVIQLVIETFHRPKYAFITLQEGWLDFFKEKDEMKLGLDLLAIWYRDILRFKINQHENIVYVDQKQQLQEQALRLSERKLGRNLQAVMDAKRKLDANTAPQLLMEQLLLRLQEG